MSRPRLELRTFYKDPKRLEKTQKAEDRINYNDKVSFSDKPDPEQASYKQLTANDMEHLREPPRRVKMLVRDFIEDALYNPHYGYFSKQATIYSALQPSTSPPFGIWTNLMRRSRSIMRPGKQLWHTPTEMFKPYYGRAMAQCIVSEYLLKYFPYEDLVIYEIGAGNGTLALDILDCLQQEYPDVYERTRYNIIEISANLASLQKRKLCSAHPCVTVNHESIFRWNTHESAPCYFLAMEVVDNFAHDLIRYDIRTLEPLQGVVTIDKNGDFGCHYTKVTDSLIASYLTLRRYLKQPPPIARPLQYFPALRSLYANLPLAPNLSKPEFIPTRLLTLLRTLRRHFPRHRLLLSDFSTLPDTIPGINAPVVQTRFQNTMVTCETLFVQQGYFDIFFPTNFEALRDAYEFVLAQPRATPDDPLEPEPARVTPLATTASSLQDGMGFFSSYHPKTRRAPVERKSQVYTHAEFMGTYADVASTRLRSGENPLLDTYKNVKFLF
ncbi:DUF185-domain-containing protein [Epithele typhae]|uniref:DUF185-domain-containing protein n=1 Tax=Epithele typhae TaxID=378194 RepID=UPI002007C804|nr:DUF185-domain-containing protein [Epithele typhae]KAH9913979.1 DUF185-domain-containing protein [Epithele typhae]